MPTNARRHSRARLLGITLVGIALILLMQPQAAQAQQTVNAICTNPGDLQAAINSIANRTPAAGNNVINVTGTCLETVQVAGFFNLIIQGPLSGTASITLPVTACGTQPAPFPNLGGAPALNIINSRNITLRRLIITGGRGVGLQDAGVTGTTLTVQQSLGDGIGVGSGSNLSLNAVGSQAQAESSLMQKSIITGNCNSGISVGTGSTANIRIHADITSNGGAGISANGGGNVSLNTCCDQSAASGDILIESNTTGVQAAMGGSVGLNAPDINGTVFIKNNKNWGVQAGSLSQIGLFGNIIVESNMQAPTGPFASLLPAGILAGAGSVVMVNPGTQVTDNQGAGIRADLQGIIRLGNFPPLPPAISPFTGVTVTGNTAGGLVLTHMSIADSYSGNSLMLNTGSDASCDATSLLTGDVAGIDVIKCTNTEQTKKK